MILLTLINSTAADSRGITMAPGANVSLGAGSVDALPPGISVLVLGDLVFRKGFCEAGEGGGGGGDFDDGDGGSLLGGDMSE